MANEKVNMSKLRRPFQMLTVNMPQRTICEWFHIGRGVLCKFKKLADFKPFPMP